MHQKAFVGRAPPGTPGEFKRSPRFRIAAMRSLLLRGGKRRRGGKRGEKRKGLGREERGMKGRIV